MNRLMLRHTMDKPLPYDAEVEYLESTGTQYIDTGITCNTDTDVLQVTFSISSFVSFCGVAGYRVGASDHNFAIGYNDANAMSADCNNSNYANSRAQISDAIANTDYTIIISRQGRYIYKGDSLVESNTSTSDIFTTGDIYIFAVNGIQDYSQIRVKNVQIERNGEEYMTLIPVRKGNMGYLYDKVSGMLFGNQGTGSFVVGPDYNPFAYQYLTFVPLEDSTFSFAKRGTGNDIEYSIDGGAWTSLVSEANTPTVGAGHNIRWRAELTPSTVSNGQGIGTFSATGLYDAMGNTMSLLYGDNYIGQTTLVGTYTFCDLWREDAHIYRVDRMVLPAMTLTTRCYYQMFYGCTSLTLAPELPAKTLSGYCYAYMFQNCVNLTVAPELLAEILTNRGYIEMFSGCTRLSYIKCLATDISAEASVYRWTSNVASRGTFVKAAEMEDWPRNTSGIPSRWTVVDDTSTISNS